MGGLFTLYRLLWWLLLVTSPANLLIFVKAIIDSSLTFNCLEEYIHLSFTDSELTGVPGFLLERIDELSDIVMEPYGVPKLNFYPGWWKKLGLERFGEGILEEGLPAIPGQIYRKTQAHGAGQEWHHWVYLSNHHQNSTSTTTKKWDDAFDELIRYHNVHPAAHNAGFHYSSCAESDLCKLWLIEAPALVHFTTTGSGKQMSRKIYRDDATYSSIAMRIFHLPLPPMLLRLPPRVFPSPFNQLLSLTDRRNEWRRIRPFQLPELMEHRINQLIVTKSSEWPSYKALNRLIEILCSFMESRGFLYYSTWSELLRYSGISVVLVVKLPLILLKSLMSTVAEGFSSDDDEELPPEPLRKVAFNMLDRFQENHKSIMQIDQANELFQSIHRLVPDDFH